MKLFLMTLGCDKNRVDAEEMLTDLDKNGFIFTADESEAEAIVVNTCCFIDSAKEESIESILEMAKYKDDGICKYLVVTGCMAQRYKDEILKEIEEVDAVVGTTSFDSLAAVIRGLEQKKDRPCIIQSNNREFERPIDRILTTPTHYAYLKIAEGCSKCCSYCAIPSIRGGYRSFKIESLIEQARAMAQKGVKEIIIIAQETTIYGTDLYKERKLHILLEEISRIDEIDRIRLLYSYPEEIYDELIELMAKNPKICHYMDMPIQHCNDEILRLMGRRIDKKGIIDVVNKLRRAMPDIVLRTSLITGFPTETEEQHKELLDFLSEVRLDHVGVFTYSMEEGTRAAKLYNQIDEDTKLRRQEELMLTQRRVLDKLNQKWVGKTLDCLIDGYLADDDIYVARSYADAPDVDSFIFVNSDRTLNSGDKIRVRIEKYSDYDFIATEVI